MRYLDLCLIGLVSASALADDISIGVPGYGGNGCPQGSASAILSPDSKTLTVLFDQYSAEAGKTSGRKLDRKACNLAIPVHIPQGLSISILSIDYRGFNSLPSGGVSEMNVEYFFAGSRGPQYRKRFYGPVSSDYLLNNTLAAGAIVWSACGADTILRANTSVVATTNRSNEQTIITLDSADIKAGLVYHLQWKRCGGV